MRKFFFSLVLLIIFLGCGSSKQTLKENSSSIPTSNTELKSPFGKKYEYVYKLIKPVTKDKLFFSDLNISVEFVIDESFIHLRLKNKRNEKISLSLNDAQILIDARASKVMNFNYLNEFNYSPVGFSTNIDIFPNAFVELHLVPSDRVLMSSGDYEIAGFYPYIDFNDEKRAKEIYGNIGGKIGLYLPVETDNEIYDYYFEFQIVDVKVVGDYYPRKRGPLVQTQLPSEIVIKGEGLSPAESFIASTLISFFVLISAYFIFAREKGKI
ncbi:hypothetical protein [Candidatus Kryptobacter tengchongensis]|uniref:Uncharacterized protein n=1 Tax=Kryptobacter tengchongensis TaxID=1643429 RepID=A0A656DAC1_KRYT1|nr:hypothetical protein [Candidatus Kryptobacter tengchongensis]CUT05375.1 hypothetical protein JGI24_01672 [Candidatus Kryptobacter tengchongensis]